MRGLERILGFAIQRDSSLTDDVRKLLSLQNAKEQDDKPEGAETMLECWKRSTLAKDIRLLLPALQRGDSGDWQAMFANASDSLSSFNECSSINARSIGELGTPHDWPVDVLPQITVNEEPLRPYCQLPDDLEITEDSRANGPVSDCTTKIEAPNDLSQLPGFCFDFTPSNAKQMVDEYLAYTNTWFPILEAHELLRTLHHYQSSPNITQLESSGQVAILWAVFAFESCKGGGNGGTEAISINNHPAYRACRRLIPIESGVHDFGHLQALLILVLINIGHGSWKSAWLLLGYAQSLGGYGLAGRHWSPPELSLDESQEKNNRQPHVLLASSMLEELLGSALGIVDGKRSRPPHHTTLSEDGLEEWETPRFPGLPLDSYYKIRADLPAQILSSFNSLCRSTRRLNDLPQGLGRTNRAKFWGPQHQGALDELRAETPRLYSNYENSHYPQFLLRCTANLSSTLSLLSLSALNDSQQSSVDSDSVTCCVNLVKSIHNCLKQFINIHGTNRLPAVLALIIRVAAQDLLSFVDVLQPGDKSPLATTATELGLWLQQACANWPAFAFCTKLLLSIAGAKAETSLSTNDTDQRRLFASDLTCPHDFEQVSSQEPSISYSASDYSKIQSQDTGYPFFSYSYQGSYTFPEGTHHEADLDEIYSQPVYSGMMQWSSNWHQDNIHELGLDNDSSEQLHHNE